MRAFEGFIYRLKDNIKYTLKLSGSQCIIVCHISEEEGVGNIKWWRKKVGEVKKKKKKKIK
jgi:hypothetical protein